MMTSEFPPRIGGVATHVAELAAALRQLQVQITVLAPERPAATGPEPQVLRHSPFIRAQPFADWLFARWCRRFTRTHAFDLVHVHGLRPLRAALGTGLPVVFTNHTSGFLRTVAAGGARRRRLGALLRGCARVLAPSEELIDAAHAAGYQGASTYIPNGVDAARFAPGEAAARRTHWHIAPTHTTVVIARRLVEKNGVTDAAHALVLTDPGVHFIFAGEGPARADLEQILLKDGSASRARLLGAIPNSQMPEIYRAADFCLLPSLMEATSIAGLEAMATGWALIGTRVGGIPALIEDGVTGLLVPPRDPGAIAEAVNALTRDRALAQAMGRAARRRVMTDFAWSHIAERTLMAYRETLTDPVVRGIE